MQHKNKELDIGSPEVFFHTVKCRAVKRLNKEIKITVFLYSVAAAHRVECLGRCLYPLYRHMK